jgi:hypothetical protein
MELIEVGEVDCPKKWLKWHDWIFFFKYVILSEKIFGLKVTLLQFLQDAGEVTFARMLDKSLKIMYNKK